MNKKPFFRRSPSDGGLSQERAGMPDLYGGDDAPRQDLAMQGGISDDGDDGDGDGDGGLDDGVLYWLSTRWAM